MAKIKIELAEKEFRRLLDLVYVGDWVLNSIRGEDRLKDYDVLQEKLFGLCSQVVGMQSLSEKAGGHTVPSQAYKEGGIHDAIAEYEDTVFFDILVEELATRDMEVEGMDFSNEVELFSHKEKYYQEFEKNGLDNLVIDSP